MGVDVKPDESAVTPRRGRGRPPQSAADAAAARARIVAATAAVFAEHGSRGLSVAAIIESAGIARPTFYRYFSNAEQPLQLVLEESDRALVDGLQTALDGAGDEIAMVLGGIEAYLAWAAGHGPALRPLFAELHDPSSPVSPHRERTFAMLRTRLAARFTALGRTPPDPVDIDVLLNSFEYVVYRLATSTDASPESGTDSEPGAGVTLDWARITMVRLALAVLGTETDLEQARAVLPGVLRRAD